MGGGFDDPNQQQGGQPGMGMGGMGMMGGMGGMQQNSSTFIIENFSKFIIF